MAEPRDALERIAALTLRHYEASADAFWVGTRDHDVRQNVAALLCHLEGPGPFAILDLGCGPGRDLATFRSLGHEAIGIDGAAPFVAMARAHSGCEVWQQNLLALALPAARFDGIFANAVLQHVPASALPRVLLELRAALRPRGVLFSSIPRGQGEEGWSNGRYSAYHEPASWQRHGAEAGFAELEHYYRPEGRPREQQPWLASVWRRGDDSPG
jgi:SAM-dependent methyltransferase